MSNVRSLFGSVLSDYTLVAVDGEEIRVHKTILYIHSDVFKLMFENTDEKTECRMNTIYKYDDLLAIVKWMYGFAIEYNETVFKIADQFMISELLNWKLYITIDDAYIERFIDIIRGDKQPNNIEIRYYDELYDKVIKKISITLWNVFASTCIYSYPIEVIKRWFVSKYRLNDENDLIIFSHGYAKQVGYDVIIKELIPLINAQYVNFGLVDDILTRRGYDVTKFKLSYSSVLPTTYADFVYKSTNICYTLYRELMMYKPTYTQISNNRLRIGCNSIVFSDMIETEDEYKDLLDFLQYL